MQTLIKQGEASSTATLKHIRKLEAKSSSGAFWSSSSSAARTTGSFKINSGLSEAEPADDPAPSSPLGPYAASPLHGPLRPQLYPTKYPAVPPGLPPRAFAGTRPHTSSRHPVDPYQRSPSRPFDPSPLAPPGLPRPSQGVPRGAASRPAASTQPWTWRHIGVGTTEKKAES
ncbi:hypothetical protein DFP72DRAFT_407678 [Ephemerocybe angulata]|uniref:Uncharacterized protein n=1 Tax=Ephemerocybe angulata TaxID=980116 RepID=A0A8H6M570_9AGAR|nr:hypothetical protein DFP72DRAFT_407678 [Tulosesus angulatus]